MSAEPPPIPGVRRSFVEANGVKFHVTEAGPQDGRPVVALQSWSLRPHFPITGGEGIEVVEDPAAAADRALALAGSAGA